MQVRVSLWLALCGVLVASACAKSSLPAASGSGGNNRGDAEAPRSTLGHAAPSASAGSRAAVALAAPSSAPPADPGAAFDPPATLRVPSTLSAGECVPLLMVLHGFGVSSSLLIAKAQLNQVADTKKFAYLAPEGTRDSLGRPFWNAGPSCCDLERRAPDDVKRLRELLEFNLKNPAVDPARVFLIGYSNGAFMAQRLACDVSDHLAGVISVAGATPGPEIPCAPLTPLSVLAIHGDADPIVHYQGGVVFDRTDLPPHASAVDSVKAWAERLGCKGPLQNVGSTDLEPNLAGAETAMQRFEGCRGSVELWTVHGGGHYVALQPPAMDAMWSFILAHPKGRLE
jgi:polyhydroxybutyrate depolymerase